MLLHEAEIQRVLDERFLPLEPTLSGFRMTPPGLSTRDVLELERESRVAFPVDFSAAIANYNFGHLTLGPVAFGNSGSYRQDLVQYNAAGVDSWWGEGSRPEALVMIANSDPFTFLLNCAAGEVLAYEHANGPASAKVVAHTFDAFFRGVGTCLVLRQAHENPEELGAEIAARVGAGVGEEFWRELAS